MMMPGMHPSRSKSSQKPDICKKQDLIKHRWQVIEKLGAGTFGQVFKVNDLKTGDLWAMKTESKMARKPVLRMDVAIAKALNGKPHVAAFFACGHEENFSYLIVELLGRNLAWRKRSTQEGKFPFRTVIQIGVQATAAIRDLHEAGYLHRDIKPSNLATGLANHERRIYVLDFGLARQYLDEKRRIYRPREKINFRGTIRYASPRAHILQELSRADDLWSLMYGLVDLANGKLPWHEGRDLRSVGEAKMKSTDEDVCKGLPSSWKRIFQYCREMSFDTVPDYEYTMRCLNDVNSKQPAGIFDVRQLFTTDWEWENSVAESRQDSSRGGNS